ncbi:MAG TPA: SgcJ/EcaC family oxidoreductase [Vicinamibacterales bacterium]|nr:SgcJ/EcaC family oxidoreductase [Vicinamibacterales bacterium]
MTTVIAAYQRLLDAWNRRRADEFAALFAADGNAVGFDGSPMNGRAEISSTLASIFAHHQTASYVAKVREVRLLRPDVALLRSVVGMVPSGQSALNPAVNAIQSVLFVDKDGTWQVVLLHNTPAAYHGRPEMVEQLTAELTEVVRSGRVVWND